MPRACALLDGIEQGLGQAHVELRGLLLELEPRGLELREVEIREVLLEEGLSLLVGGKRRDSSLHGG
jgi:hypothetical protein